MLNGERISELKPKEVPANSKAIARGSLFNEAILLPAKSKIAIKLDLPFLGQSYLQIHKL
jgi:predicted DNA repair protein MutK